MWSDVIVLSLSSLSFPLTHTPYRDGGTHPGNGTNVVGDCDKGSLCQILWPCILVTLWIHHMTETENRGGEGGDGKTTVTNIQAALFLGLYWFYLHMCYTFPYDVIITVCIILGARCTFLYQHHKYTWPTCLLQHHHPNQISRTLLRRCHAPIYPPLCCLPSLLEQ